MAHRPSAPARSVSRLQLAAFALTASLAATIVVLSGSLVAAGPGHLLLSAATVGVLTAVLAATGRHVVQPLPVRIASTGVTGAVPASTAYWCALDAPSCPQRPRAPGRH